MRGKTGMGAEKWVSGKAGGEKRRGLRGESVMWDFFSQGGRMLWLFKIQSFLF